MGYNRSPLAPCTADLPTWPRLERVWRHSVSLQIGASNYNAIRGRHTALSLLPRCEAPLDQLEWIVAVGALLRRGTASTLKRCSPRRDGGTANASFCLDSHWSPPVSRSAAACYRRRANADQRSACCSRLCRPLLAGERLGSGLLTQAGLSLLMYDRNRDRARHCLQLATRPQDTDLVAMPLPVSLHMLYSALGRSDWLPSTRGQDSQVADCDIR